MIYNSKIISKNLEKKGYFVIQNFLDQSDINQSMINYLKKKNLFVDGVIHGINKKFYININKKIEAISRKLNNKNLNISHKNFSYTSIKVKKSITKKTKLIKPFNIFKDPKILPGGVLNWHIDHFTYFFHNDHKNYLICYIPIFKKNSKYSNVAIIPYDVLKKEDHHTFKRIRDRGAVRFRKVEKETKPWFDMRFNKNTIIGNWYALDDYIDHTQGWKLKIDLESKKIVPKLNVNDLLIMKADVIHKTNDAKIDRISIRCDILPKNAFYEQSILGFFKICLKYFFQTKKAKYNLKKYITRFILDKIS